MEGIAVDQGIYFKYNQYVNSYVYGSVGDEGWPNTHIEIELFNGSVGYGWNGTYLAFFMDGTYYINNTTNVKDIVYKVTVTENDNGSTYKYTISYEVFVKFNNNFENPNDGPYGYLQMMGMTPNEDNTGYENATTITKDGKRVLWKDKCVSYRFSSRGIVERMYS